MERTTISKFYKYKSLPTHVGLEGRLPIKHKDVVVGIEIELEGIKYGVPIINSNKVTEDGSLKLDGVEFVTIPIKMRYLEVELRRIFEGLKEPLVSSRCSTHVHMNVRDMTPQEIVSFVLLYMIFERSLYRISGDRWDSNFCIPLTMAPQLVAGFLSKGNSPTNWSWYKYTGLNISPIWGGESSCIGTVEFRQLHGTTSVEEIIQWCNLITSLKRAAQDIEQEELIAHIRTMNTTSGYGWLAKEVFGSYAKLLTNQPTFVEDIETCISFIKYVMPNFMLNPYGKVEEKKKVASKVKVKSFADKIIESETTAYQKVVLDSLAKNWFDYSITPPTWLESTPINPAEFLLDPAFAVPSPLKPEGEF